jgi:hypothetical protein
LSGDCYGGAERSAGKRCTDSAPPSHKAPAGPHAYFTAPELGSDLIRNCFRSRAPRDVELQEAAGLHAGDLTP